MKCKKIRKLLITDYLDNHLPTAGKALIGEHLGGCPECKSFYADAVKIADEPFRAISANPAMPPEYVWRGIREAILADKEKRRSFIYGFLDRVNYVFYAIRPAPAIAGAIALVLIATAALKIGTDTYFSMAASGGNRYLSPEYFETANDNGGFGTSIEKYFL